MIETLDKKNILTMKLLHYLITAQNYNPIILQGAENEIWLENLNSEYKVVSINIDDEESLAVEYGVMSIPCLVVFDNGKEVNRSVGLIPKSEIIKLMEDK